jgi:hypothetical protein
MHDGASSMTRAGFGGALSALLLAALLAGAGAMSSRPTTVAPDRSAQAAGAGFDRFFAPTPTPCAIFEPGTPQEYVNRIAAELAQRAATSRYDLQGNIWSFSTGKTLRYSFMADGVVIGSQFTGDSFGPNVINARMNELFGGNTALWKSLFAQAFARWSLITGIQYVLVGDDGAAWGAAGSAARGDIRIAMRPIDGAGGILAFNNFPSSQGDGGDMVLDSAETTWSLAADNYRRLRNVVMHEHGHGIGLSHICPIELTKLMEPFLATNFDGPQHDDVRGAQAMYGDRYEPNGTTATAGQLGFLNFGATVSLSELGLRDISDSDLFAITVPSGTRLSVIATPDGFVYNQSEQAATGACNPAAPFDSSTLANLQLSILNANGQIVRTVNDNSYGAAERILNYALPSSGVFYIRVAPAQFVNSSARSQLYTLDLSTRNAATPCPWDLTADGLVNSDDLTQLLALWNSTGPVGDVNLDGRVNATDLTLMLGNWGVCPP